MSTEIDPISRVTDREYQYGFITNIEQETTPPGINEDTIRFISAKKEEPQFMLDWRLKAYRRWLEMEEPTWAFVNYPKIDYQDFLDEAQLAAYKAVMRMNNNKSPSVTAVAAASKSDAFNHEPIS